MTEFSFNPSFGYIFIVVVAVVLLLTVLLLVPHHGRTSRRRRMVLWALRLAAVLVLLWIMLRPTVVYTQRQPQPATLVVLSDVSRSMQVTDMVGGRSRFAAMQDLVNQSADKFNMLRDRLTLNFYTFAEAAVPLEIDEQGWKEKQIDLGAEPAGEQSAIGAALQEVLRRESVQRLAGIVMMTDGAWRAYPPRDAPPQAAARRMADLGIPLYALGFGEARSPDQARDVRLDELVTNPTVFVKNRLDVSATLTVNGYARRELPVQLLFENEAAEMEPVAAAQWSAAANGERLPVSLNYVPQSPGERKLTLRVAPQDGELITNNNELSTFVTVLEGGVSVLYLEGGVRYEARFLRSAVDASPDIQVDYLALSRPTNKFDVSDRFEPGKYDVVILGNVDASAFAPGDLEKLAEMVRAGAGLLMTGGFHSFGPGGYGQTPLAELLPVRMGRLERQRFGEPVRGDLHWPGPIAMRPAGPLGVGHPIMQLAPGEENLAVWFRLPPLDGANRFNRLAPTAVVLAESADNQRRPLLVAGQPGGEVRVLAFAGDSTWHWPLEGFKEQHQRFWRQLMLWLARKEDTREGVWIKLDRRRYAPRQRVLFEVGARSEDGQSLEDVVLAVRVVLPDGEAREVTLSHRDGQQIGTFLETIEAGDYTIEVSATAADQPMGKAKARFLVFPYDLELDNPAADPGLLASLAQLTEPSGGRTLAPEELSDLLDELHRQPPQYEILQQTKLTYYDRWEVFMLFVVLMSVEWFLRKRWGLV